LEPGRHRVKVVFGSGRESMRIVVVRAGTTTPVSFTQTEADKSFGVRSGIHFALGGELAIWTFPIGADPNPVVGGRAVGRMNYAASPKVDLRLDLTLAVLHGGDSGSYSSSYTYTDSVTFVSPTARFDVQINVTPFYSLAFGADLGANIGFFSGTSSGTSAAATLSYSDTKPFMLVGAHGSLLTFRFGDNRQFLVAAQEGIMGSVSGNPFAYFDQTFTFSYLFL
jgi:hypothetical protein